MPTASYKELLDNTSLDILIDQIEKLNALTPDGLIVDSDTILVDLIESCDYEFSGISQDIFNIWKTSTDKKAVEAMFYEFTDMEFCEYLLKCKKDITRAQPDNSKAHRSLSEKIFAAETHTQSMATSHIPVKEPEH